MTTLEFAAMAVAVTATSTMVDFAHARYLEAVRKRRRAAASAWSVTQWLAGSAGFVAAVGVSLWLVPFEGLGLALGTWFGIGKRDQGDAC